MKDVFDVQRQEVLGYSSRRFVSRKGSSSYVFSLSRVVFLAHIIS